jgi:trehalose 6-phosphate phosphatase
MNSVKKSTYLFTDRAYCAMKNFIDRSTLFAFDLDGTLVPIIANPDAIGIPDAVRKEIAIMNQQAVVAVITGRSRSDALKHLALAPHYLIGNHGAEGLPGWEAREDDFNRTVNNWLTQLSVLIPVKDRKGIVIENKGRTLSIHYRHSSNIKAAHDMILSAISRLVPQPRRICGKCIENLIPEGAPDKGIALTLLMQHTDRPKAFFAGDDENDEDVFRLANKGIFTVRIEKKTGSRALFHLRGQNEILRLLRGINYIIGQMKK